jgi:Tol biopolymer transport system component
MRKRRISNECLLTLLLSLAAAWPALAEANQRILFTSTRDSPLRKLYVMDADGRNIRRLGNLQGQHSRPQFSRDNRKILFLYSATVFADTQIYIMNADGSALKALTTGPNSHSRAAFTWDDRIVYYAGRLSYIMDMDGSHKTPFSLEAPGVGKVGELGSFMFGPNRMVVFTHFKAVKGPFLEQIFKVSTDGTGLVRLVESPETYKLPSWCSDGTRIAYVNAGFTEFPMPSRHERDGIYQMNTDGTHPIRIVAVDFSRTVGEHLSIGAIGPSRVTVGLSREPSFSRDCKMLTFSLNLEGGQDQVYVVNSDGSGMRRITGPPGMNSEPVFSR